jgi:hypothetical protein
MKGRLFTFLSFDEAWFAQKEVSLNSQIDAHSIDAHLLDAHLIDAHSIDLPNDKTSSELHHHRNPADVHHCS